MCVTVPMSVGGVYKDGVCSCPEGHSNVDCSIKVVFACLSDCLSF